ncbi:MAG: pantoate--beta-alanine ligase [Nitrospiraceae bacterium]|nr:pantoate--beta-alanine ligase [Nitrospiraceae bacterium]
MELIRIPRVMQDTTKVHLLHGRTIGFVPTMGALHEGHMSLVRMSKAENDITVVSIFVNPKQFGPKEDFSKYPRDADGDIAKLKAEGIDVLYMPDDSLVYPENFSTFIDMNGLSEKLCGAYRPGHFKGVCTVVAKLFNVVKPTRAYFGQKDFQQCVVIKKMVKDLDMAVEVVVSPIFREEDGLAMSSRNRYLNKEERNAAAVIYECLSKTADMIRSGIIDKKKIKKMMKDRLSNESFVAEIQYASVYDPQTLDELERVEKQALLAVALKIGETRLIDNMLVDVK